jgi:hypothetical protein
LFAYLFSVPVYANGFTAAANNRFGATIGTRGRHLSEVDNLQAQMQPGGFLSGTLPRVTTGLNKTMTTQQPSFDVVDSSAAPSNANYGERFLFAPALERLGSFSTSNHYDPSPSLLASSGPQMSTFHNTGGQYMNFESIRPQLV